MEPIESRPATPSLFDAVSFPGDVYSEALAADATLRPHWQSLVSALNAMGAGALQQLQKRVRRMRHEDGATYNLFDDGVERGIPWALEMIPLPLTAPEWAKLEAGLLQRAHLLEQILADVYGPQDLLKQGHLPPALVFANPQFLRTCHGIQPAGNRYLSYYAVDLYRAPDGSFRVVRDFAASPRGLGYALENRIVISRVFSDLYHQTPIRRLAPFFQTFQRAVAQRASRHQVDPDIVLLSPGPDSRIYFEHAFLARYLGYPLAEAQDLTVRNGRVFLKKLAGLEPVAAIWRHLADCDSDPFALHRGTTMGVAGLIQVAREGQIDIVNPIGSGFIDTPALAVFLPALCRHLRGEDLRLENHPAWWCGNPAARAHVLANLDRLKVVPALNRGTTISGAADLHAAIQAVPYACMARAPLRPAVAPAWQDGAIGQSYTILRVFACAVEGGFAFMPGGLAITAADEETLLGRVPERQQSKDIWVLSDRPVVPFSLMSGLQTVSDFRRGSDLPSRVADHLLWLGRYLERAEGLIRLLRAVFRRLAGEARSGDIPELPFLLSLLRAENTIPPPPDGTDGIPLYRELTAHLDEALYRSDRPESVVAILKRVREAARHVRDRLSRDAWRVINRLEEFAEMPAGDPLELLDDTLFTLSAFSGLAMESMTRGLGWRFMDMGRRVERALNLAGLIRVGLPLVCAESRSALEALLEVADSIMTYRARYRTAFQLAPVLDLLIADESNPKSVAFQLHQLAEHAAHLPQPGDPDLAHAETGLVQDMCRAVAHVVLTGLSCREGGVDKRTLTVFLESIETGLKEFAQQISAHYLSRVPATPHFSMVHDRGHP